jgi:hypothetical protein
MDYKELLHLPQSLEAARITLTNYRTLLKGVDFETTKLNRYGREIRALTDGISSPEVLLVFIESEMGKIIDKVSEKPSWERNFIVTMYQYYIHHLSEVIDRQKKELEAKRL